MADSSEAVRTIRRIVLDVLDDVKRNTSTKMGKAYDVNASGARVHFDGEATPSMKRYRYLKGNQPSNGERVILHRVGGSWVILGALS